MTNSPPVPQPPRSIEQVEKAARHRVIALIEDGADFGELSPVDVRAIVDATMAALIAEAEKGNEHVEHYAPAAARWLRFIRGAPKP